MSTRAFQLLGMIFFAGCVAVDPVREQESTRTLVAQRIGMTDAPAGERRPAETYVRDLLKTPLTSESAVRVALLRNRSLLAEYERVGVSQAELVEAARLSNPTLIGSARFPDGGSGGTNIEFGLVQDLLDVFLRPSRRALAEAELDRVKFEVAQAALDVVAEVRRAYFEALGDSQIAHIRRLIVDAAETSAELARRLHEAGNASDRQLAMELGLFEDTRLARAESELAAASSREQLTRLLGLWGDEIQWTLPESLPDLPPSDLDLDGLVQKAVASRLDLMALRREGDILAHSLEMTRRLRYVGQLEVGVSSERDSDRTWVTGPEVAVPLPVFDQGQGEIGRVEALLRKNEHEMAALAIDIRSEVRMLRTRLVATRDMVDHLRSTVIPLRESIVRFAQEEYNYMLVGVFEVITAKQAEYEAYESYVEAVRDWWIARNDLEHAVGSVRPQGHAETPSHDEHPAPSATDSHSHGKE